MDAPNSRVETLRVLAYGDVPEIVLADAVPPVCGPHDVVVASRAAALHFADVLMMRGRYQVRPELPFVPGMEAAGRVLSVGEAVTHVAPGDRVLAIATDGAMAGAVRVPGPQVARIPDSMSYPVAATFGIAYLTAYAALHFRAGLRAGETVLVTGARGAVGRAVAHLAKAAGASVLAVSRDGARVRTESGEHLDQVIDADPESLVESVRRVTQGRGADIVVDVVGGSLFGQLVRALAWEGRLVVVGFAAGAPDPIKPGHLLVKNISVSGLQSTDYWTRRPERVQEALADLLSMARRGLLPVPDPREFRLDEIHDAIRTVDEGGVPGVVLRIDPDNSL